MATADDELLDVDVVHEPGGAEAVLRVAGDVDTATVGELRAALQRVVANGATQVRLDLSAVPFMDSTGLTALLSTKALLEGRGTVVVESVSNSVRRTFEVAGLDVLFRPA